MKKISPILRFIVLLNTIQFLIKRINEREFHSWETKKGHVTTLSLRVTNWTSEQYTKCCVLLDVEILLCRILQLTILRVINLASVRLYSTSEWNYTYFLTLQMWNKHRETKLFLNLVYNGMSNVISATRNQCIVQNTCLCNIRLTYCVLVHKKCFSLHTKD